MSIYEQQPILDNFKYQGLSLWQTEKSSIQSNNSWRFLLPLEASS